MKFRKSSQSHEAPKGPRKLQAGARLSRVFVARKVPSEIRNQRSYFLFGVATIKNIYALALILTKPPCPNTWALIFDLAG